MIFLFSSDNIASDDLLCCEPILVTLYIWTWNYVHAANTVTVYSSNTSRLRLNNYRHEQIKTWNVNSPQSGSIVVKILLCFDKKHVQQATKVTHKRTRCKVRKFSTCKNVLKSIDGILTDTSYLPLSLTFQLGKLFH